MERRTLIPLLLLALSVQPAAAADIASTVHNLSASGPGTVKALAEDRICVFCHTPHNGSADAQLWNRDASVEVYDPYLSTTLDAAPDQPTGSSKLCLSCHDGSIALGDVLSESVDITMVGGITTMPLSSDAHIGTSLVDDHPVSFVFGPALMAADGQLDDPGTLSGAIRLDADGQMQCTSCHDPHDDSFGNFLVLDDSEGALCDACHERDGWAASSHATSTASWNGTDPDPWPHTDHTTVQANACESCHDPHGAGSGALLLNEMQEEQNCLSCHNGNVASSDIDSELGKLSAHDVSSHQGVHSPDEASLVNARHVECVDCHNPHVVDDTPGVPPLVSGALSDVKGIDSGGNAVDPALNQYEICYRCHADSPGKPGPASPRQIVQDNVRLEFDPANPSFHPIESAGVNPNVPSLKPGWTTASIITCLDCHNNDDGTSAGGLGPEGPHGSTYPTLLGWNFETEYGQLESEFNYELCYRCHDRTSILSDISFHYHEKHIVDIGASCNICHDPHGVSHTQSGGGDHTHLINWDLDHVEADPFSGRLEFIDEGVFLGQCYLRCHGRRHGPLLY